jgi:hypothetical protein
MAVGVEKGCKPTFCPPEILFETFRVLPTLWKTPEHDVENCENRQVFPHTHIVIHML